MGVKPSYPRSPHGEQKPHACARDRPPQETSHARGSWDTSPGSRRPIESQFEHKSWIRVTWGRFIVEKAEHDLAHLDPFTLRVTPRAADAPTFRVLVTFGHHTFTRELREDDPAHLKFSHNGDDRCFCPTRHRHSLELPRVVGQAATGRAFFSQNRNFLLVEDLPGLEGPYVVFFNMERARIKNIDAAMFVVSAYHKPNLPPRANLGAITFATLVSKTVAGTQVRRPKK